MKNIRQQFFKYVSLNIIGMLGLSCYILADTFFIAQGVGANGLAALNLSIPVFSLMNGIGLMIGMGGGTRFSISGGDKVFSTSICLCLAVSLIFMILSFFSKAIANILGANEETLTYTKDYLGVLLLFAPLFLLNDCLTVFVRNDNCPNLAMLGMFVGSLANIVLDYVFIFPFGWGITGAALATACAPLISILILSSHFIRKRNSFHFNFKSISPKSFGDICALGSASLVNELASGVVMIVFNFLLLDLNGNIGVAAYGILANIAIVIISIFTGISQGIQPLLSHFKGQNDLKKANAVLKMGLALAIILSFLIYGISALFSEQIISAFNKDGGNGLLCIAKTGLYVYFTAFPFMGINILTSAYFGAIDMPKRSFLVSILRGFVVIIPMAYILSFLMGINGIWLCVTLTEIIVIALLPLICKIKE